MTDLRSQLQHALRNAYTLERELAGGGMSRVFLANETSLDRRVVVKVLSPELAAGVSAERFTRETKLAARLQQANIVPVLAAGATSDGIPYYTMPFVEGESLRARVTERGALDIPEVVGILRDVCKALSYAHEQNVVHRDIKPDNVLLSGGTAVVTDFGIAKALSAARTDAGSGTLTQLGTSIGTPAYMAPEQAAGDPDVDARADLYSLGCMAYELLSGQSPFHGRTPQRMMAAHVNETPREIGELRAGIPPALANVVMRCLAKNADERPQSAHDVSRALESVTSGGMIVASLDRAAPVTLRRALALYGASFAIVAIVARASVIALGLPDWVFSGALIVMALGLPVILFTAYTQRVDRRLATTIAADAAHAATPSTWTVLAIKAGPHVSWRRTALGGSVAMGVFALLVLGFMTLSARGIGPAASLFAAGKLERGQPLLVTDFGVRGGADTAIGAIVGEALRTDLGQSEVVRIVGASAIRDALQRMRRPANSRIDASLAREIAQREGIRAIVDGDVTPLGAGFVVTVRVLTAETGDELASFRQVADSPRDLIASVGSLSRTLRGKIGESLKQVRATPALEAVSTSSLEALRKYAEGVRAIDIDSDEPRATMLLKEAVAADSAFAMAWRKLSQAYRAQRMNEDADSAIVRAYAFRDRLTPRERDNVVAFYFAGGPGRDRAKAVAAYESVIARNAVDAATTNLAGVLRGRREFARAESLYRKRIAANGAPITAYSGLAFALFDQGRLVEAESAARIISAKFPTLSSAGHEFAPLLYHRGQRDSLLKLWGSMRNVRDQGVRATSRRFVADIEQSRGQLAAALRDREEGRALDAARGAPDAPLTSSLDSAMLDVLFRRHAARGIARLDAALLRTPLKQFPTGQRPYFRISILYAIAGRPDRAKAVMAQYDSDVADTALRRWQLPQYQESRAHIALAEGRHAEAIRDLQASLMRPDGPVDDCAVCDAAALALFYDRADMPDSAIVQMEAFKTGVHHQRWVNDALYLPLILRRLGELYEAKGDRQRAAENYSAFVRLWNTADPELQPQVSEIRRRLSRIADVERQP